MRKQEAGGDSYTDYYVFDNSPVLARKDTYVTDPFTERALEFLERHGAGPEPFCLSVHYTAPPAGTSRRSPSFHLIRGEVGIPRRKSATKP